MSTEIKKKIQETIQQFKTGTLSKNAIALFDCLGYNTDRQSPLTKPTYNEFSQSFVAGNSRFNEEKAFAKSWSHVDLLFQLSKNEITRQNSLFDTKRVDRTIIETYLFFAIELNPGAYSRTALSQITREVNKLFPMPVMVLFKIDSLLTLSVINRRLHKRDESKDVLEKVTLIKDISIENPHRAHIEILFDLSFAELLCIHHFTNFVELHNAWRKTLDTKELNKRFYLELSNWYFWAKDKVSFPADVEKDEEKRNSISLIRLITRIIFIWFIKEKNLIPDDLFDGKKIKLWLKDFNGSAKSSYFYNAILQNLFFGTLNQKMDERGFAKNGSLEDNKNEYGVKNLFRYADQFNIPEKEALALFANIPFLNGGLFDCLDKPDDAGRILYSDGFSRNPKKRAVVPDYLFYGNEQDCDLNEIYGTRNKRYQVKGLVEILSSYKFTIAENTPLEEEVALDPELLGKVFENLLASYNPETRTTARKQTGSFYTPREIVDYMVDESLIAFFSNHLTPRPPLQRRGGEENFTSVVPLQRRGGEENFTSVVPLQRRGEEENYTSVAPLHTEGEESLNPDRSPKERKDIKALKRPGYMTTDAATYNVTKNFAIENRKNPTEAESILWEVLRDRNLGAKFRRQHPIDKFIVDFVCLEKKLIIELDGSIHEEKDQKEYDKIRTERLNALGYWEIRFSNNEVLHNLETVTSTISSALSSSPSPLERGSGGEVKLRQLLSYSDDSNPFTPEETETLIAAIDACKILDPACGSGAFPMGILHKLVLVLHKLDPKNEKWKKRQIQKVKQVEDPVQREGIIEGIEEAFKNNELDYGRKLFLIENCIYGIDIQPIAVQIAKLRFFISLIIDQNKRPDKDNFNIRSLPNLETKFVAADTLIGLQQQGVLRNIEIEELEAELKAIRHDYFSARTRKAKRAFQDKDKELRKKIASMLVQSGWDGATASQVARFDPYDQNTFADFFDFEWMFGLKPADDSAGVFDIVIGNPPYVQIQNFSGMKQQKEWEKQKYQTYVKTGDVYCLFYERGYRLLRNDGVLTFITSNKWMRANYGKVMRRYFAEQTNPVKLVDFENFSVFEATVNTNIIMVAKDKNNQQLQAVSVKEDFKETTKIADYMAEKGVVLKNLGEDSWLVSSHEEAEVKKKIEKIGIPLKDWGIKIVYGIKTGLNEAFIIDDKMKDELIQKDKSSEEILKPILLGKDIKRFRIEYEDLWLINSHNGYTANSGEEISAINVKKEFPAIWNHLNKVNKELGGKVESRYDQGHHWTNLRNCAYVGEFERPKIAWGNLALSSQFALVPAGYFINAPSPLITPGNKYLLAVLNSKLGDYYIRSLGVTRSGGYFEYKPMFVENLPVPKIAEDQQKPFSILVDCILFCKDHSLESESSLLESVIDGLVFDLYFLDEMKAAHCYITDRIASVLKPFKKSDAVAFKKEYISELCKFINRDETVYHGLIHRRTIKEVRIITGEKT